MDSRSWTKVATGAASRRAEADASSSQTRIVSHERSPVRLRLRQTKRWCWVPAASTKRRTQILGWNVAPGGGRTSAMMPSANAARRGYDGGTCMPAA
jgi:hypothetical protein